MIKTYLLTSLALLINSLIYSQTENDDILYCTGSEDGIYLRDFNAKHNEKYRNGLIGTWQVTLNKGSEYRFLICEKYKSKFNSDNPPQHTYLELYEDHKLLKSTLNSGNQTKSFDFNCVESKSYEVRIKLFEEKEINPKKLYVVGFLLLI